MTSAQWKAVLMLGAVFLLGSATGVGGTLYFVAKERAELAGLNPERRWEFPLRALVRRLDLSDSQRDKVSAILERHAPLRRQAMQGVMEQCGAALKEDKARLDEEIRAVLTPVQRAKFDELSARQAERMFMHWGPPEPQRRGMGHGFGRGN